MSFAIAFYAFIALVAIAGFMAGYFCRDKMTFDLLNAQSERAAYWYDKYMMQVDPSWEPLSRQAIEELNEK